jgi:acetyl-CoA carboxylase carboxyltransferase component
VQSAGARLDEGGRALDGYGRIFSEQVALSGRVPQIAIVTGTSAGGGAYSPALTDFVIMVEDALMFLTGPGVVREALGEEVSAEALGGARVHEQNGLCQLVARDAADAAEAARALLGYLPQSAGDDVPLEPPHPAGAVDPGEFVPRSARAVYDVRDVIRGIADDRALLECSARWARNIVTGFCRVDGRPVGVVANQPRHLGGVIDSAAAEKGALFVRRCDRFGVPIVALVDTPGFMPGARQESAGIIRRGAALVHAFAAARTPRLTVILRKAYGGAYITMNSRDLGADLVLAWPDAEIGVMAATQAATILFRREIAGADDPGEARERLAAEYAAQHFGADVAARDGFVDEVIEPFETRARLAAALATLAGGARSRA